MRFTIRDLLWLMVVVGLWFAWRHDQMAILEQVRRHNPMLYEAITGQEIDTNNRKPATPFDQ
jgi:hypothetical protein